MNTMLANLSYCLQSPQFAALLLDALLSSLLVLGLAGGICALWRRASAATRHLIWLLAVASLPVLPLLNSIHFQKPVWTISGTVQSGNQVSLALEVVPSASAPPAPERGAANQPSPTGPAADNGAVQKSQLQVPLSYHWLLAGAVLWLAGTLVVGLRIVVAHFARRRFSRLARPVIDPEWQNLLDRCGNDLGLRRRVTMLQTESDVMPMTWGWWRPVVLVPAEAAEWNEERRRVVLLHELAHVKRLDHLTQVMAQAACALYWFNPLVWLAARRMCIERETACDDLVLAGGCKASDYAGHLVDIAGTYRSVPQMAAIAMARSSQLESRITAIVDSRRNRRPRAAAATTFVALIAGIAICLGGSGVDTVRSTGKSDALRRQQIERLKAFSKEKEKQSETLAAAAGETISPEFKRFFQAAMKGDAETVTNLFESFKQNHPQYSRANGYPDLSLRTSFWSPVLEICLAYGQIAGCEPVYTQMAVDDMVNSIPAGGILFGGTDPGRGIPTAFSKSHVNADPFYTLTQNALADGTYLEYLHKMYGDQRSLLGPMARACKADGDLHDVNVQWSDAVTRLKSGETNNDDTQWKNAYEAVQKLWEQRNDRVKAILAGIQKQGAVAKPNDRNAAGFQQLYIPTPDDSQKCFEDYIQDAKQRLESHELKPGEDVKVSDGRTQVSGQVAVMAINGLLAKIIFDKNPGHEFFVEESFPLDWMYPYLEPHGLIMKINRHPLSDISDAMVRQDQNFWQPRIDRMIGNWLRNDTPVAAVIAFGDKVFAQHDLTGFAVDRAFVQNDYATRMFSKWRTSIAGLYAWRCQNAANDGERELMAQAADYAFRQGLALCPHSPEAAHRYANFLNQQHRDADAKQVLGMVGHFQSDQLAGKPQSSVFQIRLALSSPTDNTEPMRIIAGEGPGANPELLFVDKNVLLDRGAVKSAAFSHDSLGHPVINIAFTNAGRGQFGDITRHHLHERLAMIIDGKLWMAPIVSSEISGGAATVNGSFSDDEAKALVAKINESAAGK